MTQQGLRSDAEAAASEVAVDHPLRVGTFQETLDRS
jgi:hypothetical protein